MRQIGTFATMLYLTLNTLQLRKQEEPSGIIRTTNGYDSAILKSSLKQLVDISTIPSLKIEQKYAETANVFHQVLYDTRGVYLRKAAAKKLAEAQDELFKKGFCLLVYDAYRPYRTTVLIYNRVRNKSYAASPATGSRHNRGCSVDCTLTNCLTGKELEMPSNFDFFGPQARSNYMASSPTSQNNRKFLKDVLEKHSFKQLESEWWHFDYVDWKEYELLDIPFYYLNQVSACYN